MLSRYIDALTSIKYLTLATSATAASVAGLSAQLGQTHAFLYLQLPIWYFYVGMVGLSIVGALLSLLTDTMQVRGNAFTKVLTAIAIGLISSFIILPIIATEPPVGFMLLTALAGSFSGTVVIYLLAGVINDDALRAEMKEVLTLALRVIVIKRINKLIKWLGGN